jgi:hypothetical protein
VRTGAVEGRSSNEISIARSHCQAMSAEDIADKGDLSMIVAILRIGRIPKVL